MLLGCWVCQCCDWEVIYAALEVEVTCGVRVGTWGRAVGPRIAELYRLHQEVEVSLVGGNCTADAPMVCVGDESCIN